jgi:CP2 transcription factor
VDILQSIVRVVFHERRLQYMEKEQLDVWKLTRPGERIVDIGKLQFEISRNRFEVAIRICPEVYG